eukprot:g473.t1
MFAGARWRRRAFTLSSKLRLNVSAVRKRSLSSAQPLFGLQGLYQKEDLARLAEVAKSKCEEIRVQEIQGCDLTASLARRVEAGARLLDMLDAISSTVCAVVDTAELVRNCHSDAGFRDAANNTFYVLSDYLTELSADRKLYDPLRQLLDDHDALKELTEEQQRMAKLLAKEFERDGIHLPEDMRERARQIRADTVRLETEYSQNASSASSAVLVRDAEVHLRTVPDHLKRMMLMNDPRIPSGSALVPINSFTTPTLLSRIRDSKIRREICFEGSSLVKENLNVLDDIVDARDRLATLLGYDSYAAMVLEENMMSTQDEVSSFLYTVAGYAKTKAEKEIQEIGKYKKRWEDQPEPTTTIEKWDVPIYTSMSRANEFSFDAAAVKEYFALEDVISGMEMICNRLFGVIFSQEHMTRSEKWTFQDNNNDIRKYAVVDEGSGDEIGHIYLDLFPRQGKFQGAAHFTALCGHRLLDGTFQKPSVALLTNFLPPTNAQPQSLLSHGEVQTLFHEFGHALHSMFSRTRFQHLSGTRTNVDFVEVPSHLMEYFAWDPRVVCLYAKHHRTRAPISDELLQSLLQSDMQFAGIDTQLQLVYAAMDQRLFGPQTSWNGKTSVDLLEEVVGSFSSVPHIPGTHFHTKFEHFLNYGAGYYSYLYARVVAAHVWRKCFHADPLSREVGERWRDVVLSNGNAKDPLRMLEDMTGEPFVYADIVEELYSASFSSGDDGMKPGAPLALLKP